ncbi:MAG: hypothetical protein M1274_06200 [Actinobacteria bacterium]|nr:hypothetical protein [Actinomycetota bacterium]
MAKLSKIRAATGRPRLWLALVLGAALVPLVALAVYAQPGFPPTETSTSIVDSSTSSSTVPTLPGRIVTHTNAGRQGVVVPFSLPCDGCHVPHKASAANLLVAEVPALCGRCHDLNSIHSDPAVKQYVAGSPRPGDCLSCHLHSLGFMADTSAFPHTLTKQIVGYDDLDQDGNLSPGDRIHYRIDYRNPGPEDVSGVLLRDELDTAHVASVEGVTGGGSFDGTAVRWNLGDMAAGVSGFVTYDVVLKGAQAFSGGAATTTTGQGAAAAGETTTTAGGGTPTSQSTTTTGQSTTTTEETPTTNSQSTTTSANMPTTTIVTTEQAPIPEASEAASTAPPVNVVNIAVLITDKWGPVFTSVVAPVVVSGSASGGTSIPATGESTTTTASSARTPIVVAAPNDVVNIVVLTADSREPVFKSVVVSVATGGLHSSELPTTSTTESQATVSSPSALTLSAQAVGYDDLDQDGNLSPGDRIHYRIDYRNPGPEDVSGVLEDGTAVRWNLGDMAAGVSGFVTYDVVLKGAQAFSGGAATTTTASPPAGGSTTTENPATTTTATTEGTSATTSTDTPASESPTTTLSASLRPQAPGALIAAVLAIFPFAGGAGRRLLSRRKAGKRQGKTPKGHS